MSGHYRVEKSGKLWQVRRIDQPARIGVVRERKEAVAIARMLAGWRGSVDVVRGKASKAREPGTRRAPL